MRVITGTARGVRLKTLEGEQIRPTADKVKEAVFSMIQFEVEGRCFLDLFSGSGQMGIEALSRGAAQAFFVDKSRASLRVTRENLEKTRLTAGARLVNRTAESFLQSTGELFDIVFVDPPYNRECIPPLLGLLADRVRDGGVVICETDGGETLPECVDTLTVDRISHYGRTRITVYRK